MDEKRTPDMSGADKETSQSPQAGTTPSGPAPQGTGKGQPGGDTYQPGRGGTGGGGYTPGQSEMSGGRTSHPGQVEGKGGEGDRTNLSGMGGPDKSNWNQDPDRGTDASES